MVFRNGADPRPVRGHNDPGRVSGCFGGDPQVDEAIAFGPPKAPILQIHLLQLLGTNMGVADGHAVVGTLAGEFTDAGHDRGKRLRPGNCREFVTLPNGKAGHLKHALHQLTHDAGAPLLEAS